MSALCRCSRPLHPETAAVCTSCRHTLEVAVANVVVYHADLTTLRVGQARYGSGQTVAVSRGDSHIGMDMRFDATGTGTRLLTETRATVLGWVAAVRQLVPRRFEPVCAAPCLHTSCAAVRRAMPSDGSVTGGCRYLLRNSDVLRQMTGGDKALDDLVSLERRLARLVDRPADRWYAGVCSSPLEESDGSPICPEHLYARAEVGDVRCPACGAVHDIASRRAWLLSAAEDYYLSAAECARAVIVLGDEHTTDTRLTDRIYKWGQRGRISMADKSVDVVGGRPAVLYRLGAILDLLADDAAREQRGRVSA